MPIFGRGAGQLVPPPNLSNLTQYYDQQARAGMSKLGGMVGGAIGGGIAAAKPTHAEMQAYYEGAGPGKPPGMNFGRGMKGALLGAAEAGDEEFKREAQEFKGLQDFLEAAHGIPKNATLGKGLGELRGLARGLEVKQMQDMKLREAATDEARQRAAQAYQEGIIRQQEAAQAAQQAEAAADMRFIQSVQDYRNAYGDEGDAYAYALANVPGISADMRKQVASGMDTIAAMNARTAAQNAVTNARQADTAARKLEGGAEDPELRTEYLRLRRAENEAMARWREKPRDEAARTDADAAKRTRQQFERDFNFKPQGWQTPTQGTPAPQQPSSANVKRFRLDDDGNLVPE